MISPDFSLIFSSPPWLFHDFPDFNESGHPVYTFHEVTVEVATLMKKSSSSCLTRPSSISSLMVIWKENSSLCFSKIPAQQIKHVSCYDSTSIILPFCWLINKIIYIYYVIIKLKYVIYFLIYRYHIKHNYESISYNDVKWILRSPLNWMVVMLNIVFVEPIVGYKSLKYFA